MMVTKIKINENIILNVKSNNPLEKETIDEIKQYLLNSTFTGGCLYV